MANHFPAAGESAEHINDVGAGGGSITDKKKRCHRAHVDRPPSSLDAVVVTLDHAAGAAITQNNMISIVSGSAPDVYELADIISDGLRVPDNSSTGIEVVDNSSTVPQGVDDNEIIINMNLTNEPANVSPLVPQKLLPQALLTMSLITLIMDLATMLYKPPRGEVFGHHRVAYYLILAGIFIAGVAEASTAFWILSSCGTHIHRFSFGRAVLCSSIGPLVIIIAIGGFAFMDV